MHGQKSLLKRRRPDELQKKGFSRPELADNKSNGGPAVLDTIDITHEGFYFLSTTDLNVLQAASRDNAGLERLQNGVAVT
jgi:hypothetical protein